MIGSKKLVALCISRLNDYTCNEFIAAFGSRLAERGCVLFVYGTCTDLFWNTMDESGEKTVFELIDYDRLDAMVFFDEKIKDKTVTNQLVQRSVEHNIPVICIDGQYDKCINISFNYDSGFEKVVRHVVEEHKVRDVHFMGGIEGNDFSEVRLGCFKKVLEDNNIPFNEDMVSYGQFWSEPARMAAEKLVEENRVPKALICANDVMAITACKVIEEHGLSVPDDIIVTGFDGIEQEKYHTPRLTTAYQDNAKAAEAAIDIITDESEGIKHAVIPYGIGISQSCGCKSVQYVNINHVLMELYNKLKSKDDINITMNAMANKLTGCSSIKEALPKIESYIGVLYTGAIFICLRESFMRNTDEDLSKPIAPNEEVILAEICIGTHPEMVMKPFRYSEKLPYIHTISESGQPIMNIPLHYQERIFGFMCLCFVPGALQYDTLYNFSMSFNHSLDTLKSKEMMMTVNDMLSESNRKLENAFTHDSLTGLLNRRGFYKMVVEKYGEFPDGFIFVQSIDLDGLKYINDNFGHQEGDFAIKNVASAILKCTGDNGICARFGGDEFMAVLFSDTGDDGFAMSFSARLDDEIRMLNETAEKNYPIAASSGSQISRISEDIELDTLMRLADEKMYKVKSSRGKHLRENTRR